MKKALLVIALLCITFCNISQAQVWIKDSAFNETVNDLRAVTFINENTGWVGGRVMKKTTDGGATWVSQSAGGYVADCFFSNALTGYIVGNGVRKTSDGGNTWVNLHAPSTTEELLSIAVKGDVILVGGTRTALFKSSDGGLHWKVLTPSSYGYRLEQMAFCGDVLFISGEALFRSADYGETFSITYLNNQAVSTCIAFANQTTGYIGGRNLYGCTLHKTTDAGATWNPIAIPYTGALGAEAVAASGNRVLLTSVYGYIRQSFDYGATWTMAEVPATVLYGVNCVGRGMAVGMLVDSIGIHGIVYKTTDVLGIGENQNIILETFRLEQNYPNPFNPVTTIRYSVPNRSYVSLRIYDVNGREVERLVEANKEAGNYLSIFSAHNLASGVYFYTMQAGNFVDTKKMMVIK